MAMARPTKLSPAVQERIVALLKSGNRRGVAARAAGVAEPTFFRWMSDTRPQFREFRESVERAEAEAEVAVVATLVSAMPRSTAAAIFWLRARSPEWRGDRDAARAVPVEAPAVLEPANLIVVPEQYLRDLGPQQVRAARGDPELDDPEVRDRRRGLIEQG